MDSMDPDVSFVIYEDGDSDYDGDNTIEDQKSFANERIIINIIAAAFEENDYIEEVEVSKHYPGDTIYDTSVTVKLTTYDDVTWNFQYMCDTLSVAVEYDIKVPYIIAVLAGNGAYDREWSMGFEAGNGLVTASELREFLTLFTEENKWTELHRSFTVDSIPRRSDKGCICSAECASDCYCGIDNPEYGGASPSDLVKIDVNDAHELNIILPGAILENMTWLQKPTNRWASGDMVLINMNGIDVGGVGNEQEYHSNSNSYGLY